MAASVQTLPLTRGPNQNFRCPFPASPLSPHRDMGSVGSLVERPDVSPTKSNHAMPQVRPKQTNGLLKKGLTQRELLNYLNITRKLPKREPSGDGKRDVIVGREDDDVYAKIYDKNGTEVDLTKNSLPSGGKHEKIRFRSSAFKPVTPKNFSSMQNLYPSSKLEDMDHGLSNGLHRAYGHVPKTLSTSSSSSSPSRHGGPTSGANQQALPSARVMSQEDDNLSDSGHNSMSSLPPYRPPFRPHLAHISASMGHINTIGSLDRKSQGPKAVGSGGVAIGEMACRSMATLSRLTPYGEAPPPYEWMPSLSVEDVVRDLEERLVEKEHELNQMKRNLDESEGAIAQVFEGKQRLWEKEVEELKGLYAAKLRQVSQHAQRLQRSFQLQLLKAEQEKNRLQEELDNLKREMSQEAAVMPKPTSPTLEETQWEVCQKSGEISLLKQQLRDSQAEVTQKLSEIFKLKTQLRETRAELRNRESQLDALQLVLQGTRCERFSSPGPWENGKGAEENPPAAGVTGGSTEERLRAELLLERRQSEAQASAFEEERHTWQTEKDKVIRYQKELQTSYLEMYHRNDELERELHELRAGRDRGEGGGGGQSREREAPVLEIGGGGENVEDTPSSGLPWIEKIESSEI